MRPDVACRRVRGRGAGREGSAQVDVVRAEAAHGPGSAYVRSGLNWRRGPALPSVITWDDSRMNDDAPIALDSDVVTPLGHEVFQIDTRMAGYPGITAGYLIRSERPCLVETGTAPSAPVVKQALAELGVRPGDLAAIVVTHIHLDHAGGV